MRLSERTYLFFFAAILLFGVTVRMAAYFQAPALWYDETYTANKLIRLPLSAMVLPGDGLMDDSMQPYPAGFLAVSQLIIFLFGFSELTLRLFPFLAGILSLIMFRRLADMIFDRPWNLFAFGLFAACYPLIYRSIELKPYAIDVLAAVMIYTLVLGDIQRKNFPPVTRYALIGIVLMFFSFPSVMVMGSLGACGVFAALMRRQWSTLTRYGWLGTALMGVLGGYFLISLRHLFRDPSVSGHWTPYFASLTSGACAWASMTAGSFQEIFSWWGIPSAFAWGLMTLGILRMTIRNRLYAICFAVPVFAALLASALKVYPFAPRTVTFLIPTFVIMITQGLQALRIPGYRLASRVLSGLLAVLVLSGAVAAAAVFYRPFSFGEDVRPLIQVLKKNFQPGDVIYVNNFGQPTYVFYNHLMRRRRDPVDFEGIIGDTVREIPHTDPGIDAIAIYVWPFDRQCLITDVNRIICPPGKEGFQFEEGRRHWFVMAHTRPEAHALLISYLNTIGTQLMIRQSDTNAFLYLYDIPAARDDVSPGAF